MNDGGNSPDTNALEFRTEFFATTLLGQIKQHIVLKTLKFTKYILITALQMKTVSMSTKDTAFISHLLGEQKHILMVLPLKIAK